MCVKGLIPYYIYYVSFHFNDKTFELESECNFKVDFT